MTIREGRQTVTPCHATLAAAVTSMPMVRPRGVYGPYASTCARCGRWTFRPACRPSWATVTRPCASYAQSRFTYALWAVMVETLIETFPLVLASAPCSPVMYALRAINTCTKCVTATRPCQHMPLTVRTWHTSHAYHQALSTHAAATCPALLKLVLHPSMLITTVSYRGGCVVLSERVLQVWSLDVCPGRDRLVTGSADAELR